MMNSVGEQLLLLAGPAGPFGTEHERQRLTNRLLEGDPITAAQAILYAVEAPPPLSQVSAEHYEGTAADLLCELASRDDRVRVILEQQLESALLCSVCVEALTLLGRAETAPALCRLATSALVSGELTDRLSLRVISALGLLGGPLAERTLRALASMNLADALRREVALALAALDDACSSEEIS